MKRDERGQVTAFVVTMMGGLLLLAGLVFDGGNTISAKRHAINEAEAAARAGAQALDVSKYRSSNVVDLDPSAARQAAMSYLSATGDSGTVQVDGDHVSVTVTHIEPTSILSIAGIHQFTVTGTGEATAVRGVEVAE